MKSETKRKLSKLIDLIKLEEKKLGYQISNLTSFFAICDRLAFEAGLNLSINTVKRYSQYIKTRLFENYLDNYQPEKMIIDNTIQRIEVIFSDGSKKLFIACDDALQPKEEIQAKVYLGLIDYNGGKEVLRYGNYEGLDILSDDWKYLFKDEWDYVRYLYSLLRKENIQKRIDNVISNDELGMNIKSITSAIMRVKRLLILTYNENYINSEFKKIQEKKGVDLDFLKKTCDLF